jgi:glycosyltransferase involved in cell wall biosynthesis
MNLEPSLQTASDNSLISVVVIGRNEGERLRRCLQSISAMVRDNFHTEIIYVDSGSTDGSVTLAHEMGAKVIALQPERPTAALGRNAGWRAARGSIILFLDGDTILHPHFVFDSLHEFSAAEVAIVWGHRRELLPEKSLYNRILDLDWIYLPGLTQFCGGDALFRRIALEETGGFEETLIAGEEPELCQRISALGFTILHIDQPMTRHDLDITDWRQYWKRSTRAGYAFAEVSARCLASGRFFWLEEAKRNRNRALILLGLFFTTIIASVVSTSVLPALAALLFFITLAFRSAWRARWKSNDVVTLALYGVHSHLQQIPIYLGQLQYKWNRHKGKRAVLFEYKRP